MDGLSGCGDGEGFSVALGYLDGGADEGGDCWGAGALLPGDGDDGGAEAGDGLVGEGGAGIGGGGGGGGGGHGRGGGNGIAGVGRCARWGAGGGRRGAGAGGGGGVCAARFARVTAASAAASIGGASFSKVAPAAVSVTWRVVRCSRRRPRRDSSWEIALERGDWAMPSRWAAREKFSSWATATKYRNSRSSISLIPPPAWT